MKLTLKVAYIGLSMIVISYITYFYYILNKGAERVNISVEQRYLHPEPLENEPIYDETNNPCIVQKKKPNFHIYGRRISEEKCLEYIWEKEMLEKTPSEECKEYRRKYLNGFGILGGYITKFGDFPHMGALGWKAVDDGWIFQCGASIISEKFMITAGHCSKSISHELISNQVPEIVRLGVTNLVPSTDNYPKDMKISRIIKHPNYKPPLRYFDIALLELETEIIFGNNMHPACLWNKISTKQLGEKGVASGWGVTEHGAKNYSTVLRAVDLSFISNDLCRNLFMSRDNRNWFGLKENQICAGELSGGFDTCKGDSGGPLQVQINLPTLQGKMYYVIGVTSFGFGCGFKYNPGIYTRVANFIEWIENNVWKEEIARRHNMNKMKLVLHPV